MQNLIKMVICLTLSTVVAVIGCNYFVCAATPPQPTYGTAIVDGDSSEWNLAEDGSGDFFANMHRAAKSEKKVESKLYLRYDCETNTLYALVLGVEGVPVLVEPDDSFLKLGNSDKLVDGNYGDDDSVPDFAWVGLSGDEETALGWEASASLSPGAYNNFNVHTQVDDCEGEEELGVCPQTSAVIDREIQLVIECEPTVIELESFTANAGSDGSVVLTWQTASEIDNAGFNVYRAKRKNGSYTKINNVLISAAGNAFSGARYHFEDTPGEGIYCYKLEDIDYEGVSTMHGPIRVIVKGD